MSRSTERRRSGGKQRSRDHKHRRSTSRSKSSRHKRSRSRHRRSHSRGHRKSSRSRHRHRSSSRGHRKQSSRKRSHSREHRRHRHRSRSHERHANRRRDSASSRSHNQGRSRDYRRSRSPTSRYGQNKSFESRPRTFKDALKAKLLAVGKEVVDGSIDLTTLDLKNKNIVPHEKPSDLPLCTQNPLTAMANADGKVTPQIALLQTMAAMHQKAQELTGIVVPKYYNPAAINPLKYAEQINKRKLLWSKTKDTKDDAKLAWGGTQFEGSAQTTDKFRKLMGIRGDIADQVKQQADKSAVLSEQLHQKQNDLFDQLDRDYQQARITTHTQRGVGLGFTSSAYVQSYVLQKQAQVAAAAQGGSSEHPPQPPPHP